MGPERERDPAARCHAAHPLPAWPVGSLQGRSHSVVELGNPHRRNLRQPGTAAGARGAAARGVVVQRGRLFESRRRRPVAVHALDRPALHAHRRRRRRAARSVPFHRGRRATAGLQLPGARQLAAGADRLQPRRGRHAPRQGNRGHRRLREDQPDLQQPHLRLRVAQLLSLVPGRADHRRKPGEVLRSAATASRDQVP